MVPMVGLKAQNVAGAAASGQSAPDPGKAAYQAHCAACHGNTLGGGFGPPVRGEAFRAKWAAAGPGALLAYITREMPPTKPAGLPKETYRAITQFIERGGGTTRPARSAIGPAPAVRSVARSDGSAPPAAAEASTTKSAIQSEADLLPGQGPSVLNKDAAYDAAVSDRSARLAALSPVDEAVLRNPPPGDWLQWRRTDDVNGYSPLDRIDRGNVGRLSIAWVKPLTAGVSQITPLVHDGVMFLNSAGTVSALDVRSGATLWSWSHAAADGPSAFGMSQPKGMAMFENSLFVPTLDNHMIALDMKTGSVLWDRAIATGSGPSRMSGAPIVVHGKVIQGTSSCTSVSEPQRCYIVALDARTGAEIWRFHTVPHKGEPNGDTWNGAADKVRTGGGVWSSGSFDPVTNLVYFGTGQTYHISGLMLPDGKVSRANSGLYTDSTLALDPDTGKLAWHFQHMARDVWDLDWAYERTLFDVTIGNKRRRAVATIGKLGILDVLDAATGKYLFSYDTGYQTLVTAIDPVTGRKTTDPAMEPQTKGPVRVCPFASGVRNWQATSYDPVRRVLYAPTNAACMDLEWEKGADWDITYSYRRNEKAGENTGGIKAVGIDDRTQKWESRYRAPVISAVLATKGGLVFEGGRDRQFRALDSDTGRLLWQTSLDRVPASSPITFADGDGTQYVAVATGGGSILDTGMTMLTPEIESEVKGTTMWVFKLSPDP